MISVPIDTSRKQSEETKIYCDYLVVGAGAACLSFVDTTLMLRKDVSFVMVDRNSAPGGHWTKAYSYVRLHQPSCYYGVNSLPLGSCDKNGMETFDNNERASGKEICEYYKKVVANFEATGRVRTYFDANYEGEAKTVDGSTTGDTYSNPTTKITHTITTKNGQTLQVACTKVVRCESNVEVPSMRKSLPFPIDESVVKAISLNELPSTLPSQSSYKKYLVLGGGKTGVDAIIYMLKDGKVCPDQITWIVPRPAWYFIRDRTRKNPVPGMRFWKEGVDNMIIPMIVANSAEAAFLNMERTGAIQRVDPDDGHVPQIFKGATIDYAELKALRSIPKSNLVKNQGRVTSITANEVVFASGAHSIPFSPTDTLVVDCTTDNFYGYPNFDEDFEFFNPNKIRLGPFTRYLNPCFTSAQVAFLEAEHADTAAGDDVKNSCLYFLPGPLNNFGLEAFLLSWYAHLKTGIELNKCPNYQKFALSSRTDRQHPSHHGGILGLMWAVYGPTKMHRKALTFRDKMENCGYKDFPTDPLPGRTGVDAAKLEANMRYPSNVKPKSKPRKLMHKMICKRRQNLSVSNGVVTVEMHA